MLFLLEPTVFQALERAQRECPPSAEQRAEFIAAHAASSGTPRILNTAGSTAEIRIEGVLTKRPDFLAFLFGGGNATYPDIIASLRAAQNQPSIRSVVLAIDSPGGTVDGLFETLDAIDAFKKGGKKLSVRASMATSAAYAIAAAAGNIEATTRAATFGSIGVAASFFVSDRFVDIASTEAPKKRPNVATAEGQAIVREHLDDIHSLFVTAIAKGRGTSTARINADFGRGGLVLAGDALSRGMIDKIAMPDSDGSETAAAQHFGQVLEAIRAGKIQRLPGESDEALCKRAIALGPLAFSTTHPAQRRMLDVFAADLDGQGDLGDRVVAEMEHRRTKASLVDLFASDLPTHPERK